jgi:hypothetical protein
MSFKSKYPDDYIREKRSIIAAAELTYVRKSGEGQFSVIAGEDEYVLTKLDDALHLASNHILGDGPLDSVQFSPHADDEWHPDMRLLLRELGEAGRRRKK